MDKRVSLQWIRENPAASKVAKQTTYKLISAESGVNNKSINKLSINLT